MSPNNSRCIRQLNDIVRRFSTYQRSRRIVPFGVSRKSGTDLQDESENGDIMKRKASSESITDKKGNNMSEKRLPFIRRVALQNKFEGNTVNTHQNIQEFNERPLGKKRSRNSTRRSESIALDQLTEALENIAYNKGELNEEDLVAIVEKELQRLAVHNNIKGNVVKTDQNIKEYNEELVERRRKLRLRYDLMRVAEELRRIATKNDIKGNVLNTTQNVQELNDDVLRSIVKAFKRMAIQNQIKGSNINTYQNVQEYNDDVLRRLASRLSIGNQITGNNNEPNSYDDDDASENLRHKSKVKINKKKGESDEAPKKKDAVLDKSKKNNSRPTRRISIHPYSRSNFDFMQGLDNYILGQAQWTPVNYYPTDNGPWNYGENAFSHMGMYSDEKNFVDEADKIENDADEEKLQNDELAESDISSQIRSQARRLMTINNNVNPRRSNEENVKTNPINKSLKEIECKTKGGKKISDSDLNQFLDLLKKTKVALKNSVSTKTL